MTLECDLNWKMSGRYYDSRKLTSAPLTRRHTGSHCLIYCGLSNSARRRRQDSPLLTSKLLVLMTYTSLWQSTCESSRQWETYLLCETQILFSVGCRRFMIQQTSSNFNIELLCTFNFMKFQVFWILNLSDFKLKTNLA
jgi:hypothetical protein